MPLSDFLTQDAVVAGLKVNSKKQALQELAERAAAVSGLPEREIFDTLLQRERLGSTGIGHGIAIPHGKLARVPKLFGVFAKLDKAIDFEALDGEPVDLVFVLIAPESAGADHLKALARVARVLRDTSITQKLRAAETADALYAVLMETPSTSHAA
ncbi:PTS IIA-like nitrogen regulatory protein PtsN [Alsobacter sp. R-9]